jgi:hypothetical protein
MDINISHIRIAIGYAGNLNPTLQKNDTTTAARKRAVQIKLILGC